MNGAPLAGGNMDLRFAWDVMSPAALYVLTLRDFNEILMLSSIVILLCRLLDNPARQ